MKHLKLELEKAQSAYNNGSSEQKKLLIDLYGKENFLLDIKERVTDYESACEETGRTPLKLSDFDIFSKKDRKRYWNRHQLTVITEALNEGWEPDFDKSDYKYYTYFYKDNGIFSSVVLISYYYSVVGSDLVFKNNDLANYARKKFTQTYINYHF